MGDESDAGGRCALTVFLRDLHLAVIGDVAIPVELDVDARQGRWEASIEIRAVAEEGFFPTFTGTINVTPVGAQSELWLQGVYRPPFGALGGLLDSTVLRHTATRSLQSFLSRVAMEMLDDVRRVEREYEAGVRGMHP